MFLPEEQAPSPPAQGPAGEVSRKSENLAVGPPALKKPMNLPCLPRHPRTHGASDETAQ
jgi:hypothetical protein